LDLGGLAVAMVNAKLDVARIGGGRVEAVAPLKPRLTLRVRFARLVLHHRGLEDGAGGRRGADAHAPISGALRFLVSEERVIAVQNCVVRVKVTELFVLPGRIAGGQIEKLLLVHDYSPVGL